MLAALKIAFTIAKSVLFKLFGAIFKWIAAHPKEAALIALCIACFVGGAYWRNSVKNSEIATIKENFREMERLREQGIIARIREIENDAKKKAEDLNTEKNAAEKKAAEFRDKWEAEKANRKKRVGELTVEIEKLKKSTKPEDKDKAKELELELLGLKFDYQLSSFAVFTINGFVDAYSK